MVRLKRRGSENGGFPMSAANVSSSGSPTKTASPSTDTVWDIDSAHSAAHFKVRHLMVSQVRGTLGTVSGTVWLNEKDLTQSRVDVRIDATTLETRDAKRDEHLRSADFLAVANHPVVTFVSRQGQKESNGNLRVTGDLTIRNPTKQVTPTVEP